MQEDQISEKMSTFKKLKIFLFGNFIKVPLTLHPVLTHDLSRKAEGLGPAMP